MGLTSHKRWSCRILTFFIWFCFKQSWAMKEKCISDPWAMGPMTKTAKNDMHWKLTATVFWTMIIVFNGKSWPEGPATFHMSLWKSEGQIQIEFESMHASMPSRIEDHTMVLPHFLLLQPRAAKTTTQHWLFASWCFHLFLKNVYMFVVLGLHMAFQIAIP